MRDFSFHDIPPAGPAHSFCPPAPVDNSVTGFQRTRPSKHKKRNKSEKKTKTTTKKSSPVGPPATSAYDEDNYLLEAWPLEGKKASKTTLSYEEMPDIFSLGMDFDI
jgi:hypothetical protein